MSDSATDFACSAISRARARWPSARWAGSAAAEVDDHIPPPLSGPEHSPRILDNLKLWIGVAVVLVLIAYSVPLAEMVMDGLFSPGALPAPV